jgi:hypothetical protein
MQVGEGSYRCPKHSPFKEKPFFIPINLFVYPSDIQGWANIVKPEKSDGQGQHLGERVLGRKDLLSQIWLSLTKPGPLLSALEGDKAALLEEIKALIAQDVAIDSYPQAIFNKLLSVLMDDQAAGKEALKRAGYPVDNLAQVPGFLQAKRQTTRRVQARQAMSIDDLLIKIKLLRLEGMVVDNLTIETHGEHGTAFYIGPHKDEYRYRLEDLRDEQGEDAKFNKLRRLGKVMSGKLVLMGCELGRNTALIQRVAEAVCRPVIASKSWVTDWFGMFNDPETHQWVLPDLLLEKIAEECAEPLRARFGGKIRKSRPWYQRWLASRRALREGIRKEVELILKGFFSADNCPVSPSGSADALFDSYYYPGFPYTSDHNTVDEKGQEIRMTKKLMEEGHKNVGRWIEVDPVTLKSRDLVNFYFNPDGEPSDGHQAFGDTKFGKAYTALAAVMRTAFLEDDARAAGQKVP